DAESGKISDLLDKGFEFQVMILPYFILSVHRKEGALEIQLERERDDSWIIIDHHCEAGVGDILELRVPFSDLDASAGEPIRFRICLSQKGVLFEEHPQSGSLQFIVPGPHFEEMDWEV